MESLELHKYLVEQYYKKELHKNISHIIHLIVNELIQIKDYSKKLKKVVDENGNTLDNIYSIIPFG
jgi:hypothetical protein